MNALERFSQQMKTLDETAAAEAKEREKEQKATAETKESVDESARFSLILPPPPPNEPQPNSNKSLFTRFIDAMTFLLQEVETTDEKDPVKITPRKRNGDD